MFKVLLITFSGIGIGLMLRNREWITHLSRSITYTIWLLLLFFGLQVGANELVVKNLDTLGLKALAIAVAGSIGSSIAALIVLRYFWGDAGLEGASERMPEDAQEGNTGQGNGISKFMGGFTVVAFFALGCLCGWLDFIPEVFTDGEMSMYVLYFLMIQVGMSIGSDRKLKEILGSLRPRMLLLPAGTIAGTLIFVAGTSFFLSDIGLADTLAVGSGFGYYSLSSVLITQIKEASLGVALAAQLGTIALMANIMREVITLLLAPLIHRIFGKLAPISVGGATSMDSTLPVITAVCGKDMVFISIFHGVLVDFSVPFLVTFFASL